MKTIVDPKAIAMHHLVKNYLELITSANNPSAIPKNSG